MEVHTTSTNDGHESKSLVRVEGDACPDSNDGMAVMNDATCTTATAVENAPKAHQLNFQTASFVDTPPDACSCSSLRPCQPPPTSTSSETQTAVPRAGANESCTEVAVPAFRKGDGWAPIKPEFIRSREEILALEKASKPDNGGGTHGEESSASHGGGGPGSTTEEFKKGKRGRNRKRPKDDRPALAETLCVYVSHGNECRFGSSCRFSHDIKAYLEKKGPDIRDTCPIWDVRGSCPSGVKCRFGSAHTDPKTLKPITKPGAADPSIFEHINDLSRDLQAKLRRNQVPFACNRKGWPAFLSSLDSDFSKPWSREVPPTLAESHTASSDGAAAKAAAATVEKSNEDRVVENGNESATVETSKETIDVANHNGAVESSAVVGLPDTADAPEGEGAVEETADVLLPPLAKRARCQGDGHGGIGAATTIREGSPGTESLVAIGKNSGHVASCAVPEESVAGAITSGGGDEDTKEAPGEAVGDTRDTSNGGASKGRWKLEGEWVRSCLIEGVKQRERRTVDFEGKVYVAPLTTVGNLPFRRVMKDFGADITCGEMALSNEILKGKGSEWALLRRHPCEDVFGVQVAGAHPDQMTRVAELLEKNTKVDFVDINMGCPIDLVCDKGMGAALMGRTRKLRGIIAGMTSQLSCPLTVKMRVGWDEKKPNADVVARVVQHEAYRCRQRGFPGSVAHVMVHGRSRLQRYSKLADWGYVRKVAASQDPAVPPLPVIGNGDILTWRDHEDRLEQAMRELGDEETARHRRWSTCCMLARGALIKPWLPTEIKEKRDWDISAKERLDIYRNFVNYGLEHWGSDQMGVNKTRRFLLEWLSFTCRYIPLGILEVLPQRINERPVPYNGRDQLESLLCSQNPADWIMICEMLLGPVPEGFEFVPKHKANSYAPQAVTSFA